MVVKLKPPETNKIGILKGKGRVATFRIGNS